MESKNVVVTLRLDKNLKKNLEMLANEENRSLNNMISTIIIKYLDERKEASDSGKEK